MIDRTDSSGRLDVAHVDVVFRSSDRPAFRALDDVSVEVNPGEFVSIVGPSGCGKTTILHCLMGLLAPTGGTIRLDSAPLDQSQHAMAMVYQDPRLLPWRTLLRNVSFGLEARGVKPAKAREIAYTQIERVGLKGFENFYPGQLSGGMRQRANLARAWAVSPRLLLMDEPFAALDAQSREYMQEELLSLWSESRITTLFVTHQIDEAIFLSDRVLVMASGPGRVVAEVPIVLPHMDRAARVKSDPAFLSLQGEIWSMIRHTAPAASGVKR